MTLWGFPVAQQHQEIMGADMEVDNSPEAPGMDIVVGSREASGDNGQTKSKRLFREAFKMRPPVDEEPQYVSNFNEKEPG